MKKATTICLGSLLACYALAIFLPVNPDEARPGSRLSGDVAKGEIDLSSIKGVKLVTVQTSTWYLIPHSVTVTSWVADDNYYLGCGRCATKVWPKHIARNPEVVVKIDGKLYEGQAFLATGSERRTALSVPLADDIPDGDQAYRVDPR
ncbi:MAG: hypothetical protein IH908_09255 [Proteobacteria bacterium]|nr:hypothetical protein [Pseudomonadota bacterium]